MPRDYEKEYAQDQKKRKKYRAKLRQERVKRGLTSKDGYANGNGDKHISHKSYAKGKQAVRLQLEVLSEILRTNLNEVGDKEQSDHDDPGHEGVWLR